MNLKLNVFEIKRLMKERREALSALSRFLISKGVAPSICAEIVQENDEKADLENLRTIISSRLKVTGEFSFQKKERMAFVGPTGVGKTSTIMKLVAYYRQQKKSVSLMSLDEEKKERLHQWAAKQGIGFVEAAESADTDLLLIDTEGCNFYQPNRIDALGEKIAACAPDVEVLLTLSAAAKEVDLYGAIHQFSPLRPSSLLFTKFDETLASGVVINISVKTDIPMRYIAYGFPLPGEVQIANKEAITHKILTDFNEYGFQFLRQLTLPQLN